MNPISVTQVNKYIKNDIENDIILKSLQVIGEISNLKYHNSGHLYFSLKDNESKINCVMFSTYASRLLFKLEDGMKIVVTCSVGVYVSSGSYQLYVYNAENVGLGGLFLKYEQLKKQLAEEGLFDESFKKQLPKYPINIGVISAKEGAAIRDIITTIQRRWPIADITLIPCLVQGVAAVKDIISNLNYADSLNFDVIIIARGGGSIEDLWCFNDENVARTIFNLKTPIVSAIGHEIDFTICDYVSDYRCPTPTGAGESVTPDINEVLDKIDIIKERILINFNKMLDINKKTLETLKNSKYLTKIETLFADRYSKLVLIEQKLVNIKERILYNARYSLDSLNNTLKKDFTTILTNNHIKLNKCIGKIDELSPLKIMSKGYGIVSKNENIITSIEQLKINDELKVSLKDGDIISTVKNIKRR